MADDKKKDSKGPPKGGGKKDAKPADGGGSSFSLILGVIVIAVILAYAFSGRTVGSGESAPSWRDIVSGDYDGADRGDVAAGEAIDPGSTVVNAEATKVRVNLSGAIAGEQPVRAKGVVKDGPTEAFGRQWYFVDYEEAPDGWVEASSVTEDVGVYTATHIVPIAFDFFRPLAIGLALAVAALLVYLWWQGAKDEHVAARRAAEDYRAYLERTGRAPVAHARVDSTPLSGAGDAAPLDLPGAGFEMPSEWGAPSPKPQRENQRWAHIRTLVSSTANSDWRQAIIEADIMLEEMLRAIGYDGVTIGDMLKNVDPADFVTLDKAWEAHKIRNQIAHRGMDFRVERTDAERTIKMFEDVFREFNYL